MQSHASSFHLTQSLDQTQHSFIKPNPKQTMTVAKMSTRPDPAQPNPLMDPTHVHLCSGQQ